ncbi:MAG: GEVED domain-containing protein, partial [Candidatus Thermoplasmatota archaeon]
MPDGARYEDVASPYTISGLTNGKTYYFRVTARNAAGESDVSAEVSATPTGVPGAPPMYVTGRVQLDTGAPAVGADVTVRGEDGTAIVQGTTGADGRFNIALDPSLPTRILAEATYRGAIGPTATGFRWSPLLASGGAVDVGRILVPDPTSKRIPMVGASAASPDGAVIVTGLPPNVASMWARSYDPDAVPDIFPGDLAEGRDLPLNSVVFLWISALDAGGAPVVDVNPPATVRLRVPTTQWVDLEDWLPGNGVIDTPVYSFDYGTAYWAREADGLLTDAAGTPIGEAQETVIRRGLYAGDVYAEFRAGHFSWWNIDKPPRNCTTDFGDAPDPTYPTLLASDGARHQDICRAWLGAWVDGEADADVPDLDLYDDGLLQSNPIAVRVSNWNWSKSLYLNALIDDNADGDWSDAGEWALQNLPVSVPAGKGERIDTDIPWDGKTWMRLTLTGATITDYNGTGAFAIGETEDYPFVKHRLSVWVAGNGTVTSDPPGIDCRKNFGTCSAEYAAGTVVNLTADPDPGESFVGWGGDCAGSNATCSVTMTKDRSVYATFTQPYYRLTVYITPDPPGNQTYWGNGTVTSDPPG